MSFSTDLLAWYDHSARSLPWRGERAPYRIWLSEVMLQQTQAETVKGYYARFLAAYPDVAALAAAEDQAGHADDDVGPGAEREEPVNRKADDAEEVARAVKVERRRRRVARGGGNRAQTHPHRIGRAR